MKRKLLIILFLTFAALGQVFAQSHTVTGTVTAEDDGLPIPGASVKIKGTATGTQTNTAGKYTLSVPQGATLVFSFIGYAPLELSASGSVVNAKLKVSSQLLGEVVVTGALGIKKQAKEVGYATTLITGANANETEVINPINGLTGKVAGLVIQQTNDGIDPTIKVNLRGNRSLLGNNSALLILDGVPVSSSVIAALSANDIADVNVLNGSGAAALYGSEASNGAIVFTTKKGTADSKPVITYTNSLQLQQVANLPKTQSMYGQYGGEGNYTLLGLQNYISPITGFTQYVPWENELWGPAFNGQQVQVGFIHPGGLASNPVLTVPYSAQAVNPVKAFFQVGVTEQNDITFAQGDSKNSFNFDAQDSHQTGITPMDENDRISARLGVSRTYGIFRADFNTTYTRTTISTTGGVDYLGNNNLYANLLQFPANLNINAPYFKNTNSDPNTPGSYGNPTNYFSAYSTNPWWTIENNRTNIERNIFSGNLLLTLSPTKWLDMSYRVSDYFGTFTEQNTVAGVTFSPYVLNNITAQEMGFNQSYYPNGIAPKVTDITGYGDGTTAIVNAGGPTPNFVPGNGTGMARLEGDATISLHKTFFNNWKTSLLLGNTIWEENMNYSYDQESRLLIPGLYNQLYNNETPTLYTATGVIRQIDFFGDLNIGYKDWAYLEATLRNDQDSRLAIGTNSFFYPSVKLSIVPTDIFPKLRNNILDYAKFYADDSRVGQVSLPPYSINPTFTTTSGFPFGGLSGFGTSGVLYPPGLKPEQISEFEIGTELGLFNGRLDFKADYYNQVSRNQTLSISTSPATGYNNSVINAGEVQSQGYEFTLNAIIFPKGPNSVGWTLGGNFSLLNNKVISLIGNQQQLTLQTEGGGMAAITAVVGKSYPQLFTTDFVRDPKGQEVVNPNTGQGTVSPSLVDQGGANPNHILGLNTSVSYKFMTLNIVAEYRGGNVIYNGLGPEMTFAGSDAFSSQAGREIFIIPNSVIQTGPNTYEKNTTVPTFTGGYNYWVQPGSPSTVGSTYVTSAAFWKIREVSLDFNLNQFINKTKFIKGLTFGLDARNLFTFLPKSEMWGDPELSDSGVGLSGGNGVGGSNSSASSANYQLPSTRYFGAKLQVTF
jgi:TonB-linked SusC/RagA family outer membrane protein